MARGSCNYTAPSLLLCPSEVSRRTRRSPLSRNNLFLLCSDTFIPELMSREKSFLSLPLFINLNSAPLSARPPSSSPCLPCHGLLYRTPRSLAPVLFWHLITPNSDYLMFRRRYLTSRRGTHVIHLIQRPASSTLSANYSLSCKNIIFKVLIYSFFFPFFFVIFSLVANR